MYLHLGEKTVVSTAEIIGIFDMDTSTVGKHTRDFLAKAEKGGRVVNVSYELPKSFVLCGKTGLKSKGLLPQKREKAAAEPYEASPVQVYISQISSSTLRKRSLSIDAIKNSRKAAIW